MKFGQSIEDKMRNIFLRNHKQNVVEKLVQDPSQDLWINSLKYYQVFFFVYICSSQGLQEYIKTNVLTTYI